MTVTRILTTAAALVAIPAAALGAAATASAAPARVSATDQQFLTEISSEGIGFASPQGAIQDAHRVCQLLSNGATGVQVFHQIVSKTTLSERQATAFIADSVAAYCPDNAAQLTA